MAMDMGSMMKMMSAWGTFKRNHPKFPAFCKAVSKKGIQENSIIEIAVTAPDGEKLETNLKVTASDLELLRELGNMSRQ